jgi:hypothetical protein
MDNVAAGAPGLLLVIIKRPFDGKVREHVSQVTCSEISFVP